MVGLKFKCRTKGQCFSKYKTVIRRVSCGGVCVRIRRRVTWAVAAQHPGLDEGSRDTDVVKETAVLTARLQPRTCDQHLHSALRNRRAGLNLISQCGFFVYKNLQLIVKLLPDIHRSPDIFSEIFSEDSIMQMLLRTFSGTFPARPLKTFL